MTPEEIAERLVFIDADEDLMIEGRDWFYEIKPDDLLENLQARDDIRAFIVEIVQEAVAEERDACAMDAQLSTVPNPKNNRDAVNNLTAQAIVARIRARKS
jgi:hypothetical protein